MTIGRQKGELCIRYYRRIKAIDDRLIKTNQQILELTKEVFFHYNQLFYDFQKKYNSTLGPRLVLFRLGQDKLNKWLVVVFMIASIALILLLLRNFRHEKDLEKANKTICNNLLAKDRLISLITHDIRTPLNLISIYSEQLKKKFKDLDQIEKFELLQYTANNSLLLSNQILDLASKEDAYHLVNNITIDLKEVLSPILKTMRTLTEEGGNVFEVDFQVPENIRVRIDQGKLSRLYYNLIGNANSSTWKGKIKVFAGVKETENGYILSSFVEDTGIGIEEKFLEKIFDPYSQVERKCQYNHFGVGLGLYLCKEIVKLYNGTIGIKSKPGCGTTVSFELQLDKAS